MPSAARSASAVLLACALGLVLVAQPSWAAIKLASPTTLDFHWTTAPKFGDLYHHEATSCAKVSTNVKQGATDFKTTSAASVLRDAAGTAYTYLQTADTGKVPDAKAFLPVNVYDGTANSYAFSTFTVPNGASTPVDVKITKLYTDAGCSSLVIGMSYVGANQLLASDPAWTASGKQAMGGSAFILMGISVQGDNNNGQSVVPCGLPATFQFTSKCGAGKPVLSSFVLSPVSSNEYVYVPDQANSSPFVFQGTCSITVGSDVIPLNYVATHPSASTFTVDLTPGTFVNDLSGAGNLRLTFLHVSSMFRSYW